MYDHPIAPDTAGYTRLDHVWLQDMVFHLTEDVTWRQASPHHERRSGIEFLHGSPA